MKGVFAKALIITGPTASGKTLLSEQLAQKLPVEIINADLGQFYNQLSVGTAKPDFKNYITPCHIFNIIDAPTDINVIEYRQKVQAATTQIRQRNNIPVIVGGSLFYIKSLFFPPSELANLVTKQNYPTDLNLWVLLNEVDPERAAELNPNDLYRIKRALDIWYSTKTKPSSFKPKFEPLFAHATIIWVCPPREVLRKRIEERTQQMVETLGWIDEVRPLVGTHWEEFFKFKGLLGYSELAQWIKAGEKQSELPEVIKRIQELTCQYAKRQITFWQSFKKQLAGYKDTVRIIE